MTIKIWGAGSTQGSDGQWDTPTNWDNDTLPVDGDSIHIDGSALYPITTGPSISIILESILIDSSVNSAINGFYINSVYNSEHIIVYGSLINMSPDETSGPFWIYGVTSISGKWSAYIHQPATLPPSLDSSKMLIGINSVIFSNNNYISILSQSTSVDLKYGTSNSSLSIIGESNFNTFTIDNVVVYFDGLTSINSQEITLNDVTASIGNQFGAQLPFLNTNILNLNNISYMVTSSMGLSNTAISIGGSSVEINVTNNMQTSFSSLQQTSSSQFLNIVAGNLDLNLYGYAVFYGTLPNQTTAPVASPISSNGIFNITAYDTSRVCGYHENGSFKDVYSFSTAYSAGITLRNSSIFIGIVSSGMGNLVNFLDSSYISPSFILSSLMFAGVSISYETFAPVPMYDRNTIIPFYKSSF